MARAQPRPIASERLWQTRLLQDGIGKMAGLGSNINCHRDTRCSIDPYLVVAFAVPKQFKTASPQDLLQFRSEFAHLLSGSFDRIGDLEG